MRELNQTKQKIESSNIEEPIYADKFDYTEWQKKLWQNETVESLSTKAQEAWNKNK